MGDRIFHKCGVIDKYTVKMKKNNKNSGGKNPNACTYMYIIKKMSYSNYDIEDFATDSKFREWVLKPNPALNFFWEKWMQDHPSQKQVLLKAKWMVKAYQFRDTPFSREERELLLKRINTTLEDQDNEDGNLVRTIPMYDQYQVEMQSARKFEWTSFLKVAVLFIAVLGISFYLISEVLNPQIPETKSISMISHNTESGQRLPIRLPDGSVVILNANSTLTYPEVFDESARTVELLGEAFFKVRTDSLRPFSVRVGELEAQVLGTEFNVEAYPEQLQAKVALVSGKVRVHSPEVESVDLLPGEMISHETSNGKLTKGTFDYNEMVLWKDGVLFFQNMAIPEVFKKIEKWYGVEVQITNKPNHVKPISGSYTNEHLENVLQSISYTVNFQYELKGKKVYIKFN